MFKSRVAWAAVVGLAASASATVTVSPLVMSGDSYGGFSILVGTTASENFAVSNSGGWLVLTTTNNGNSSANVVLVRGAGVAPGTVYVTENDPIAGPAGARVSTFDSLNINGQGSTAVSLGLRNTGSTTTDTGVYFNLMPRIIESDIAGAAQFSPGTPYTGFQEVRLNEAGAVLVLGTVDDAAIASTTDRAIVRIDDAAGAATQTVLIKEGDEVLPGRPLAELATAPESLGFAGNFTVAVPDLDGSTSDDSGVLRHDGTAWSFVVREGDAAPVMGRTWASFASAAVAVNRSGAWAVRSSFNSPTTDDLVIVRNGTDIIAREGSPVPGVNGAVFTGFGAGPIHIDDGGNVYYIGTWTDASTTFADAGVFRNGELLVRAGFTLAGNGERVSSISDLANNLAVSPNGRYVLFEGDLFNPTTLTSRRGTIMVQVAGCPADFNGVGGVTVQDIFDFLVAYFAGLPTADFNGVGGVTVQDIFDFLVAYFNSGSCS